MTTNTVPAAVRRARSPDKPERTAHRMYIWLFAVLILANPWFGLDLIRSATATDARGVTWSPDGRHLAVVTTDMAGGSGAVLHSLSIDDKTAREDWARALPSDWNGLRVESWLPGYRRMLLSGRHDVGSRGALLVTPDKTVPYLVAGTIYGLLIDGRLPAGLPPRRLAEWREPWQ